MNDKSAKALTNLIIAVEESYKNNSPLEKLFIFFSGIITAAQVIGISRDMYEKMASASVTAYRELPDHKLHEFSVLRKEYFDSKDNS